MTAGAASCFQLAARPLLAQDDRATPIESRDVKRVLADIDTDHGDFRIELLCHGVLWSLAPLASFSWWRGPSTAGPSHYQS
jgi:hypothetical protein